MSRGESFAGHGSKARAARTSKRRTTRRSDGTIRQWLLEAVGNFFGVPGAELLTEEALGREVKRAVFGSLWTRLVFFLLASFIVLALAFLTMSAVGANWANVAAFDPNLPDKARELHTRELAISAPAVFDSEGTFIGIAPGSMLAGSRPDRAMSVPLRNGDVPDGYRRVIAALEQRSLDTFRSNVFGADWTTSALAAGTLGQRGGASSIPQQLARVVLGLGATNEGPSDILARKWTEATYGGGHAIDLQRRYGSNWVRPLITEYASVQPIASSPEISGLYAGSEVLFGKRPDQLSDAQAAFLAATAQRPINFRILDNGRIGLTIAAERALRNRAAYGIRTAFSGDAMRREQALRELDELPPLTFAAPTDASPGALMSLLQPSRRAARLAGSEIAVALKELNAIQPSLDGIQRLNLSIATIPQHLFKSRFVEALQRIDAQGTLGVRLTPSRTFGKPAADVVALEVDPQGLIRRFYSNTDFQPLDRSIELASTGKIIAALALPGRCNLNANYLAGVFARSHPEELEPILSKCASRAQLARLLGTFNLQAGSPNVAHAISYGMVSGTPRMAIAAYSALADRLRGGTGEVREARMLVSASALDGRRIQPERETFRLGSSLVGSGSIDLARVVLRAPALPGGTIAGLAAKCPGLAIAKTGTLGGNGNDGNRGRLLAGAFNDGRAFFIFVSARDGGLIGNLGRQNLIELALPFCQ